MINKIIQLANKPLSLLKLLPEDVIALTARFAIASVFWRSAQTKINGWDFLGQSWQFFNLNSSTLMLFEYEYDLPFIAPELAAYLATFAEFFVSIAIFLGFMTRFSALAFLGMTATIQFMVYPDAWPTHILWVAILLYIVKHGPGKVSLDNMIVGRS
ncbi:MAG: putative oxidoreductase [Enterobacterales bacterium]|jgi:putative oxidoreductase